MSQYSKFYTVIKHEHIVPEVKFLLFCLFFGRNTLLKGKKIKHNLERHTDECDDFETDSTKQHSERKRQKMNQMKHK